MQRLEIDGFVSAYGTDDACVSVNWTHTGLASYVSGLSAVGGWDSLIVMERVM